jgi:hypothetical protein
MHPSGPKVKAALAGLFLEFPSCRNSQELMSSMTMSRAIAQLQYMRTACI